jgi:hypothetical protein
MANNDEDDDANEPQRRAVAAVLLRHHELQALAAGRTAAAGLRMVLSSRARQRASMKPYLLSIGTQCRVSFLFSQTIRMHTKTALVGTYSPTYTPDVYRRDRTLTRTWLASHCPLQPRNGCRAPERRAGAVPRGYAARAPARLALGL